MPKIKDLPKTVKLLALF